MGWLKKFGPAQNILGPVALRSMEINGKNHLNLSDGDFHLIINISYKSVFGKVHIF